ncbi:MAG: hypothetical protein M0D53_08930 [Flavobacterium sp. JAD_PAG50586_2]|nr:MAG: hypothetical protein M0D53_08930 [Flavobacterium sp. JAD_PAG50586_2]
MKKISILILLIIFSCKSSESETKHKVEFNQIDSLYLKTFNATENKYSLLFFGQGYFNNDLEVVNCEIIKAEDSTETEKVGPFAKIYRIENSCDALIKDSEFRVKINIKTDSIRLYKFIYIDRDFENDSLKVTYKNNHIPVK